MLGLSAPEGSLGETVTQFSTGGLSYSLGEDLRAGVPAYFFSFSSIAAGSGPGGGGGGALWPGIVPWSTE